MAVSQDYSALATYEPLVKEYHEELMERLFVGFDSAKHLSPYEGIKGRKTFTEFLQKKGIVVSYNSTFSPGVTFELEPIHLDTDRFKYEMLLDPGEIEENYLGMLRKKGQDPKDNPIELVVLRNALQEISEEMEYAVWQGVKAATVVPGTTKLIASFDGFGQQIIDAVTATTLTVNASGALTSSNIGTAMREMYDTLHPTLKMGRAKCYASIDDMQKYLIWRSSYAQYTTSNFNEIKFDTGNMEIVFLPGVPANCLLITFEENLMHGYDGTADTGTFRFNENLYTTEAAAIFRLGVKLAVPLDGYAAVNNQWSVALA